MLQILNDSRLSSDTSQRSQIPPSGIERQWPVEMEVIVYFSTGTARSENSHAATLVCNSWHLDAALRRSGTVAVSVFRTHYECNVPGS